MIVDFQQHYTPPELLKAMPNPSLFSPDERGNQTICSIRCFRI